jgi:pimeloyl-ACP methyl ester carboxylesterase
LNLVLLPGLDGTGLLFRPLLAALPSDIRPKVIAYPTSDALTLAELASLVVRQLPADGTVLLAESFSGLVALTLLMNAQTRVRGVIFVAAFAEPPRPFLLRLAPLVSRSAGLMRVAPAFLLRQYCLGKNATASDLKMLREAIAGVSPEVLGQRFRLVATRHSFAKLRSDVPGYYIRASGDRLVPPSCATWFEQRLQCEIIEVEGPHFLLQARPKAAVHAIVRMVQSLNGK